MKPPGLVASRRVYSTIHPSYFWRVYYWSSQELIPKVVGDVSKDSVAVCHENNAGRRYGDLHFSVGYTYVKYVAHEVQHAILWQMRRHPILTQHACFTTDVYKALYASEALAVEAGHYVSIISQWLQNPSWREQKHD